MMDFPEDQKGKMDRVLKQMKVVGFFGLDPGGNRHVGLYRFPSTQVQPGVEPPGMPTMDRRFPFPARLRFRVFVVVVLWFLNGHHFAQEPLG